MRFPVLDLLYCYQCGDVSLGGHVVGNRDGGSFVSSQAAEASGPRSQVFQLPRSKYVWFRPGPAPVQAGWNHKVGDADVKFQFATATLDPKLGFIYPSSAGESNGTVVAAAGGDDSKIPALPTTCAHCGHREFQNRMRFGVVRSPIRAHTQGASQATQMLVSEVVRSVGTDDASRKTIVFSDSRDDASRTAVGVSSSHFFDLTRHLVQKTLTNQRSSALRLLRDGADATAIVPEDMNDFMAAVQRHPEVYKAFQRQHFRWPMSLMAVDPGVRSPAGGSAGVALGRDHRPHERCFGLLGIPPGGACPFRNWSATNLSLDMGLRSAPPEPLADPADRRRTRQRTISIPQVQVLAVGEALFGPQPATWSPPAWVFLDMSGNEDASGLIPSILRITALGGRWRPLFDGPPPKNIHESAQDFIRRVARVREVDEKSLREEIETSIAHLLSDGALNLTNPAVGIELVAPSEHVWVCKVCSRGHLHPSAGVCVRKGCPGELEIRWSTTRRRTTTHGWRTNRPDASR